MYDFNDIVIDLEFIFNRLKVKVCSINRQYVKLFGKEGVNHFNLTRTKNEILDYLNNNPKCVGATLPKIES